MKAVIFAGGLGTRLSEATNLIPKPMVEIGGKPILWHIMKTYSHYGINECVEILDKHSEDWRVTMVDTGLNTQTGGRLKRVQKYIGAERFVLTYGDGVADINIAESIKEHELSECAISLTAYKPGGKFGALQIDLESNKVLSFQEKPDGDRNWINAGYFVCEPEILEYIPENDDTVIFERKPLENLAKDGKMHAYRHTGFWKPMDTLRDNVELNEMWDKGLAPWKVW